MEDEGWNYDDDAGEQCIGECRSTKKTETPDAVRCNLLVGQIYGRICTMLALKNSEN